MFLTSNIGLIVDEKCVSFQVQYCFSKLHGACGVSIAGAAPYTQWRGACDILKTRPGRTYWTFFSAPKPIRNERQQATWLRLTRNLPENERVLFYANGILQWAYHHGTTKVSELFDRTLLVSRVGWCLELYSRWSACVPAVSDKHAPWRGESVEGWADDIITAGCCCRGCKDQGQCQVVKKLTPLMLWEGEEGEHDANFHVLANHDGRDGST